MVNDNVHVVSFDEDAILPLVNNAIDKRRGGQWALKDILTMVSINEIVRDIVKGTAVAISDGSYKDNRGTTA